MSTSTNLNEAFAGESQASQKYRAFARKAEQDGLPNVARLFRTAAEAEVVHAQGHFRAMDGVASTGDNLKAAIAGETYEFTTMYPPMLAEAETEGHRARFMFGYALKAEAVHAALYKQALAAVEQGKDLSEAGFYLCPVCGNIEFGTPPVTSYGYLNGIAKTAVAFPIGITVPSGGLSAPTTLSLTTANAAPLSISSAALPAGTVKVLYSQALAATDRKS